MSEHTKLQIAQVVIIILIMICLVQLWYTGSLKIEIGKARIEGIQEGLRKVEDFYQNRQKNTLSDTESLSEDWYDAFQTSK